MILGGEERYAASEFMLVYDGFDPSEEGLRETLTSTRNGYLCIRGAVEWDEAGDGHYPGTYAHDVYNRRTTILGGPPVPNEDLVNLPNCSLLQLRIEDEEPIRLAAVRQHGRMHLSAVA
jgi:trehalose/maltose hydrolase-like predicted phosphorylase